MDYEKKYRKALERAKRLHSEPTGGTERIVCEQIFPELMGSEDERIRQELIGFLRNIPNSNYTCEEMALWLEKQGEKETGEWKEGNVIRRSGILALAIKKRKAMKSNGEIFTIQHPDEWVKAKSNEIKRFFNGFAKQCELPRYSIGDILCDLSCNEYDKNAQLKYEIIDIKNGTYICDNGSIPVSQQDEYKLVAKKAEQKPVKVNNDEDSVSNELREASFIFAATQMVHKASPEERKLELIYSFEEGAKWQAVQKHAWSKEDEDRTEKLLGWLNTLINYIQGDATVSLDLYRERKRQVEIIKTWLKSLKALNTWEPSDKQIKALKNFTRSVCERGYFSPYDDNIKLLYSLLEDLKKLK